MVEKTLLDPSNSILTRSKRRTKRSRARERKKESVYLAKKNEQTIPTKEIQTRKLNNMDRLYRGRGIVSLCVE